MPLLFCILKVTLKCYEFQIIAQCPGIHIISIAFYIAVQLTRSDWVLFAEIPVSFDQLVIKKRSMVPLLL